MSHPAHSVSPVLQLSHLHSAGEDGAVQQGHSCLHCPEAQWVPGWRASDPAVRRQVTGGVFSQRALGKGTLRALDFRFEMII